MEYVKINSLWKRQGWYFEQDKKKSPDYQAGRQSFIIGDYAQEEFGSIKRWRVDEKVDGTNIRIFLDRSLESPGNTQVRFGGRTGNAQIPCHLLDYLQSKFTPALIDGVFPVEKAASIILYGEGYGPKIQSAGANYRNEVGFMLFDIFIGGWWMERESVKSIAQALGIEMVPDLGVMNEEEIVEFVKSKPLSRCSFVPQMMEGIVARSHPLMLFRNGKPIMWKLKCKEFI